VGDLLSPSVVREKWHLWRIRSLRRFFWPPLCPLLLSFVKGLSHDQPFPAGMILIIGTSEVSYRSTVLRLLKNPLFASSPPMKVARPKSMAVQKVEIKPAPRRGFLPFPPLFPHVFSPFFIHTGDVPVIALTEPPPRRAVFFHYHKGNSRSGGAHHLPFPPALRRVPFSVVRPDGRKAR